MFTFTFSHLSHALIQSDLQKRANSRRQSDYKVHSRISKDLQRKRQEPYRRLNDYKSNYAQEILCSTVGQSEQQSGSIYMYDIKSFKQALLQGQAKESF